MAGGGGQPKRWLPGQLPRGAPANKPWGAAGYLAQERKDEASPMLWIITVCA